MSRFDNEPIYRTSSSSEIDSGLREFMVRVYGYMGLGLGISALAAFMMLQNPAFMVSIASTPMIYAMIFAPLVIVMFLGARLHKMTASTAQMVFLFYSAVMGMSLSFTLALYTTASVVNIFLISASLFGSMSIYGYTTQKDLTSMGSFMMMGVWGLIIASVVNMFLGSGVMDFFICVIAVIVFTGLTAYDTQNIKNIYYVSDSSETAMKKAIIGALQLYIDFINIFIALLRLFGERR